MSKILVAYFSKYGTTKKYAEWIASEFGADICPLKELKRDTLPDYDTIIVGSGLYAGSIKGADFFVKNRGRLKGKKLVLFTCGSADYKKAENINEITKRIGNEIPENIGLDIKVFCLRGGVDYEKLSFAHRTAMGFVHKILLKKKADELTETEKEFINIYRKKVDYTDKNSIKEIIDYCGE